MSFHHSGVNCLATCMFCIHPLVIYIQHSCNQTLLGYHRNTHETGVVCAKARRDIVQTLHTLILQHTRYPSSEEYTSVSRKLVEQFPKLHDGESSDSVSIRKAIYPCPLSVRLSTLHHLCIPSPDYFCCCYMT